MTDIKIKIENLYKIFGPKASSVLPQVQDGMSKTDLLDKHGHVLGSMAAEAVECAGLDERFDGCAIAGFGVDAFAKVVEIFELAASVALDGDSFGCATTAGLDCAESEKDFSVGYFEVGVGGVHIWWHHFDRGR